MLPLSCGSLGIIDPKTQLETLFAKLLVQGLFFDDEP